MPDFPNIISFRNRKTNNGFKKILRSSDDGAGFFVNMAKYYIESGEKWGKVVEKGVASGVHGGVSTYHR
ncbi:hypothetical protein PN4B1_25450 [Paenibacillus naphthalenovorans]|nr:hypothetical protein PN4B1_25450 [Paenibacillus naphthalenovorans]